MRKGKGAKAEKGPQWKGTSAVVTTHAPAEPPLPLSSFPVEQFENSANGGRRCAAHAALLRAEGTKKRLCSVAKESDGREFLSRSFFIYLTQHTHSLFTHTHTHTLSLSLKSIERPRPFTMVRLRNTH